MKATKVKPLVLKTKKGRVWLTARTPALVLEGLPFELEFQTTLAGFTRRQLTSLVKWAAKALDTTSKKPKSKSKRRKITPLSYWTRM